MSRLELVLDDQPLNGPQAALVNLRPQRVGVPVDSSNMTMLFNLVAQECQVWGGANTPLIPASEDGKISSSYTKILPGSAVDRVLGLDIFGLYHLSTSKVSFSNSSLDWGRQLAVALLKYHSQEQYRPLNIAELAADDPWRAIYIACLGSLPVAPDEQLLKHNRLNPELAFDDFVQAKRQSVKGSLDDLLARLSDDGAVTPRQLSMVHLAHGSSGSTAIRDERQPLPDSDYARFDAGPNVVVVCSPGDVEDIALLWNLRAAHGDRFVLPIGLPAAEVSATQLTRLARHQRIAHNGISRRLLYVTSASLSVDELKRLAPGVGHEIAFANQEQMLTLGSAAGWPRDEVLVWHDSDSSIVPSADKIHREVLTSPGFNEYTHMMIDIALPSAPIPAGDDVRAHGGNFTFAAGVASRAVGTRRSEAMSVTWPTRMLSARVVAERRDLRLDESEPGRAAMVALSGFTSLWELSNLAHAPLLELLAEMAARQGMSWYKNRLRSAGQALDPAQVVAPTADDLPEKSLSDFKRVLGNSEKAAKYWLFWAERHGLIVKGFPLECATCRSKQWTPVAAFAPPIVCRGCATPMETPFGDRPLISFKYRLSERLRRVYESDAIGHLLAMRYFQSLFDSRLIGIHPGLNVLTTGGAEVLGEADNLLLFRNADLIPVEVKRTFAGVLPEELSKLTKLATALRAPWSAVAVCQYGHEAPDTFVALENRGEGADPFRLILSYDALLEPHAMWALGADPFAWAPRSTQQITEREARFVQRLAQGAEEEGYRWLDSSMLRRPG